MMFWLLPVFLILNSPLKTILGFAQQLEQENDLYRAILEYKRARFLTQDPKQSDLLSYKIAVLYEKLGDYTSANRILYEISDTTSSAWRFERGRIAFLSGNFRKAQQYWASWDTLAAWAALRAGDFASASRVFGPIPPLSKKSPLIAALLSAVIPGLGKGYLHRWGDGIYSFWLTVGSTVLAYSHAKKGTGWPTYLYTGLAVFFYTGNVYGSWIAARTYNSVQRKRQIATLEFQLGLWRYLP